MALKDVWQQAREIRQAELDLLRQEVAEQRSQNQADLKQMTIELREGLAPLRAELSAQNQARQLEEQCYRAGLAIEVQERRESVQNLLEDLQLQRQQTAQELRSHLAAFRADLTEQTQALRQQRQAEVQDIRDYVWGSDANASRAVEIKNAPIPATLATIDALLDDALLELEPSEEPAEFPEETAMAIDQQLERLDDRILSALSSDSGVRLNALQSTLKVSRNDLVRGLQQLIQTRQVVARDRMYFRSAI